MYLNAMSVIDIKGEFMGLWSFACKSYNRALRKPCKRMIGALSRKIVAISRPKHAGRSDSPAYKLQFISRLGMWLMGVSTGYAISVVVNAALTCYESLGITNNNATSNALGQQNTTDNALGQHNSDDTATAYLQLAICLLISCAEFAGIFKTLVSTNKKILLVDSVQITEDNPEKVVDGKRIKEIVLAAINSTQESEMQSTEAQDMAEELTKDIMRYGTVSKSRLNTCTRNACQKWQMKTQQQSSRKRSALPIHFRKEDLDKYNNATKNDLQAASSAVTSELAGASITQQPAEITLQQACDKTRKLISTLDQDDPGAKSLQMLLQLAEKDPTLTSDTTSASQLPVMENFESKNSNSKVKEAREALSATSEVLHDLEANLNTAFNQLLAETDLSNASFKPSGWWTKVEQGANFVMNSAKFLAVLGNKIYPIVLISRTISLASPLGVISCLVNIGGSLTFILGEPVAKETLRIAREEIQAVVLNETKEGEGLALLTIGEQAPEPQLEPGVTIRRNNTTQLSLT